MHYVSLLSGCRDLSKKEKDHLAGQLTNDHEGWHLIDSQDDGNDTDEDDKVPEQCCYGSAKQVAEVCRHHYGPSTNNP